MPVLDYIDGMRGKLIYAARALLGMSQDELAKRAGVSKPTIVNLERDGGNPTRTSEQKVVKVLEADGIGFDDNPDYISVRLTKRPRQ